MPTFTIQQTFDLALRHHRLGQLAQAQHLYQQILAQVPEHADAQHLLAMIALHEGQKDAAIELLRRVVAVRGNSAEARFNLANVFMETGRFGEAIVSYRQAIALKADYFEAYSNLGNALLDDGQFSEAIGAFRQAVALRPNLPQAHFNLANACKRQLQLEQAAAAYRQAIALDGAYYQAYVNLGNVLAMQASLDEAIAVCRRAITINPALPQAYCNLGNALVLAGGREEEAIAVYRQVLTQRFDSPEAHCGLGNALLQRGQLVEAMAAYQQANRLSNDYAEAHYGMARVLLAQGDLAAGWREYEWRWKCRDWPVRNLGNRQWDGAPLKGQEILLHAEQGLGDALQFFRYVPMAIERGGKVVLECPQELHRLFAHTDICPIVVRGTHDRRCDLHCSLMSLPHAFGTTLETIPRKVPYLYAPAAQIEHWRERMATTSAALKVGIAWAGSDTHQNDHNRSLPAAYFADLGKVPGVQLFSLQKGPAADKALPFGMNLIDFTAQLNDFADTAALIANLDLVICVDTAVAHLSGAMGKPTWTLLPHVADWRWLLQRGDSPWYPTMRLFRQKTRGDWDGVMRQVADALADFPHPRG